MLAADVLNPRHSRMMAPLRNMKKRNRARVRADRQVRTGVRRAVKDFSDIPLGNILMVAGKGGAV